MDRLLENDLAVKLVSVLLALILWLQVARAVPETQRSLAGVPVQLRNAPPGLEAVAVSPAVVTVTIRGRGRAFAALTESDLVAQVDLAGARAGRFSYRVDRVTVPRGVTLVGVAPEEVQVTLEAVAEREVPVRLRVTGRPAAGYEAGEATVVPERVLVRGRESLVAAVAAAEVTVSVADAAGTVSGRQAVALRDGQGRPVTGVGVFPAEVAVTVPVRAAGAARAAPYGLP